MEIAVFGHEGIFEVNGYSYAFNFYRVVAQRHQVKLIIPKATPFLKEKLFQINENLSLYAFGPSTSFFLENQKHSDVYDFAEIAEQDEGFVKKARSAVGDAPVIIADTFTWGRFIAKVFPDRRLIVRSLDVEQIKVRESYAAGGLQELKSQEAYDRYLSQIVNLEGGAYRNAEHILALTAGDIESLSKLYDVPLERFSLLPTCVYNIEAYRGFRPEKIWNSGGSLNVFFIGFMIYDNWRALEVIAEAAALLPDVTFHICGRYFADQKWKRLEERLTENVRIYGEVSEEKKRELIQYCDCALNLSSQTYGMNTKLLDYMLYGTPILSTRTGVRGYALREYEHFFPCEADELCGQLQKFAAMPIEERKQMANNAYGLLLRDCNYERYWRQVEKKLGLDSGAHEEVQRYQYIIFGGGVQGERALRYLEQTEVRCVGLADNNPEMQGKTLWGRPVFSPAKAFEMVNEDEGIHLLIATMKPLYLMEMYGQAAEGITDLGKLDVYYPDSMNSSEIDIQLLLSAARDLRERDRAGKEKV